VLSEITSDGGEPSVPARLDGRDVRASINRNAICDHGRRSSGNNANRRNVPRGTFSLFHEIFD
jgi:hypothetical protein